MWDSLALGDDNLAVLDPAVQFLQVELAGHHSNGPCDGQGLCHYLAGSHGHVVPAPHTPLLLSTLHTVPTVPYQAGATALPPAPTPAQQASLQQLILTVHAASSQHFDCVLISRVAKFNAGAAHQTLPCRQAHV